MVEINVTDATFDAEVVKSTLPVLVDFYALWCVPCQMQNPILEEVAKEFEGKIKVAKLNVDDNPATASQYSIMSIPTLVLFKKGIIVKQMLGVQSKENLVKEIKKITQ